MKRNYQKILILVFLMFISTVADSQYNEIIIPVYEDAVIVNNENPIAEKNAYTSYGNRPDIFALKWTHAGYPLTARSLLKFDLSGVNPSLTLVEAELKLYGIFDPYSGDPSGYWGHLPLTNTNAFDIYQVLDSWSEFSVTWANQPAINTNSPFPLLQQPESWPVIYPASWSNVNVPTGYNRDYSIIGNSATNPDFFALVQSWLANPNINKGLMMQLHDENKYTRIVFGSREHYPVARAELILKFECPELEARVISSDVTCHNIESGKIEVEILNKDCFSQIDIKWFDHIGNEIIDTDGDNIVDNLPAGLYTVEITTTNGQVYTYQVIIAYSVEWAQIDDAIVTTDNGLKQTGTGVWNSGAESMNITGSRIEWAEFLYDDNSYNLNGEIAFGINIFGDDIGDYLNNKIDYGFIVSNSVSGNTLTKTISISYTDVNGLTSVTTLPITITRSITNIIPTDVYKIDSKWGNMYYYLNGNLIYTGADMLQHNLYNIKVCMNEPNSKLLKARATFGCMRFNNEYEVNREMDGGYFYARNNKLYFEYDEEYNDLTQTIDYEIYDDNKSLVSPTGPTPHFLDNHSGAQGDLVKYGDNRYVLDVTGLITNHYYILKIKNEKKEDWYLRFKKVVDGGWSDWSDWTGCDNGETVQTRERECNNPAPSSGGIGCIGPSIETRPCPTDGYWSDWSPWSSCIYTPPSLIGYKYRTRQCTPQQNGGIPCSQIDGGNSYEEIPCGNFTVITGNFIFTSKSVSLPSEFNFIPTQDHSMYLKYNTNINQDAITVNYRTADKEEDLKMQPFIVLEPGNQFYLGNLDAGIKKYWEIIIKEN